MMKKKGLVIVYDPQSLHQFVWYYCTYGLGKKWDALCLPNGYKGTYMDSYCKNVDIFSHIFVGNIDYLELPIKKKAILFSKMFGYWITGRRKTCCKKILNQYVQNIDDYDELVSLSDTGFVSGLFALLGREKRVVYLDDGTAEYGKRSRWRNSFKTFSATYWQGFFLSKMGYSCKGRFYFEPTRYCYKFSTVTDKMLYRNYKAMLDLYDMTNTDVPLYNQILIKVYPNLQNVDFDRVEAVFFTDNLAAFSDNYQEFYDKCTRYMGERFKSVLIKKHPRDDAQYNFGADVKIQEIDSEIPAELLLDYIAGKEIYFSYFSSVIISMQPYHYFAHVMYSKKIYKESKMSATRSSKFLSRDEIKQTCERFAAGNYDIIDM